jgi:rod shape-determining protein MreC
MAVISPNGVVGVVKLASSNFSSVLSILHSDSRTPARVKRTNFTGTILWDGRRSNIAQMIHIPSHAEVQIGDTITTNSFSLAFPEGVLIGVVEKVQTRPNDEFNTLDIRLSTNFNTIDHVYIVKNLARDELEQLKRDTENGR